MSSLSLQNENQLRNIYIYFILPDRKENERGEQYKLDVCILFMRD